MFSASKSGQSIGKPDPQFNYVTALLHGDGTNGAQNNTFLDSSSNAFSVTRSGTPTQGSFSPYGSLWSNYFNGTGNYLSVSNATPLNLSGGSYTIEFWIYPSGNYTDYNTVISKRTGGSSAWEVFLSQTTGYLAFFNGTIYSSSVTPSTNTWNHVAAVYDGTNINLYLNGTRVLQSAITNTDYSASIYVGSFPTYNEQFFGYISNVRVTKSGALYTTTFTPSTSPLTTTVSSGTVSLLTCQSNRFIDNSTNAYAITPNGTPSVQRFNPFLPTYSQAYSTSVYGGSGYFNGSTDYLAFTASSATNCTGDFTLEGWVYLPSITVTGGGNPRIVTFGGTVGLNIVNEQTNNNYRIDVGASTIITSANNVAVLNTWQHFAVVRSGSTMTLYVNGVSKGTATYSSTITNSGSSYIGSYNTTSSFSAGYLSEIRFVVGTAVYTSAFTPPTAPLTAITNTQLLMSYQNGAIYDNAMMNDLITVGSAQISTSVVKYGTGSISFNGTNSYLKQGNTPQLQDYQLGSGDFTIEAWIYKTANGSAGYDALSQLGTNGNATDGWFFEISSSRGYVFSTNSTSIISYNSNPNTSAWQHVAVSKSGNNTKMFVNGSQVGSTYTSAYTIPNTATQATIGVDGSLALFFNGYVDDFRITKGYARYTTTFTPPTTALPNYGS